MERRKRGRDEGHPLTTNAKLRSKARTADRRKKGRSDHQKNARITLQLSAELIERLRNVVYWTPGVTLTAIVAEALRRCVEEREKENGGAFPTRVEKLRIGRPPK